MIHIKQDEFKELTDYLKSNYGINLTKKKILIEGRLNNILIEKGFKNFRDYLNFLFNDMSKNELTLLINKLTTNHTFFMREAAHFQYFKNEVLPYLESKVKDRDLRIWSAGCSSGEEPYTLAMILQDYFQGNKAAWDKKVLATDISVNVIHTGERGIYSKESIENIPASWKLNYFNKIDNDNYQVSDKLRKEVIFRIFNLMDEVFPFKKKFHVIFCRNVMIYFDAKTKMELVNKFYKMTEPGGYIFIGHSESISRDETDYRYIMPGVYRKG
ncbi:chemotaxis protein CheR [Clostridium carboxidivorans P7]|uniref:protein-glutamate O-methyltransferase n=1 Tax=Clostridium carboxidivorans P7 TaxID=536227 RepID=C6PXU5_9CLOT|nr:protein-glutamate O-methyltransferase CheR [Clostridium carboxidivorans]AKN31866.1 chemotaxis protein CheR [Clostridium carboxidivorans P7]EET85933.1 MCP methyltransferase, CheR-type [Clostridium carboxidivorans P7]EFG87286.1 CheR methyltransferase, SAM binding domain protein [Clostridium carboxidivorans P7]